MTGVQTCALPICIQATVDQNLRSRLTPAEEWYTSAMTTSLDKTRERYAQMAQEQAESQQNQIYTFTPEQVVVEEVPESEVPDHIKNQAGQAE